MIKDTDFEKNTLEELCSQLDEKIMAILGFNPYFSYYKKQDEDFYTIHNKIKSLGDKRFDLNMRIYNNKDEDKFLYVYMLWFSVNPKKVGVGSAVITEIIELLKAITKIEFIVLHPDDNEVKYFWMKNNFMPNDGTFDNKINVNTRRILIYAV